MHEATPLQRQWLLLRMLSRRGGAGVREMSAETGVTQKTIRRDLTRFRSAGFVLSEQTAARGKKLWRLEYGAELPGPSFDFDELAALFLGRRFLEPLTGTVFADAARSAFAKIRTGLSESALQYLETLASRVYRTRFGTGDYGEHGDAVESLRTGVEDRRVTRITYRSMRSAAPAEYPIHPYGLVLHRDSLYLVAHSIDHGELRHFKVDRVIEAEVQADTFEVPTDFDLADHLGRAFGIFEKPGPTIPVRIRFTPVAARFVEESRWHETQRLERTADGHLIAEFEVTALEEVKSWVLSFGAKAEVLKPEELRESICLEVRRLAGTYFGETPFGIKEQVGNV